MNQTNGSTDSLTLPKSQNAMLLFNEIRGGVLYLRNSRLPSVGETIYVAPVLSNVRVHSLLLAHPLIADSKSVIGLVVNGKIERYRLVHCL